MASGVDDVTMANLDGKKSKGRKDKHVQTETSGWGMIFKFMGKCVPLKSGNSQQDAEGKNNTSSGQPVAAVASPSTNSNAVTAASTSNKNNELKIDSELRKFSFNELKMATRNFRPEYILGEGGFGRVFKGWIGEKGTGRPKPVAVKTLDHEGIQGHKEWLAEITYLGELHHPNLVKLIGYCIEDEQRLLVYEFMARGSLENHLFRRNHTLIWSVRLKIMLGAAKGLAFLHEEAARPVIFRDFKTSNILLDEDYNAKLSDFGLAKDGPVGDSTHVSTRVLGTQGYAAPEYFMTGHLSTKSDVYSFGIVLLEMLTGRKAIDRSQPHGERNLVEWCRPRIGDGKNFFQLMDPRLYGIFSMKGARKALVLASRCIQRDPKARPQMSEVVAKLTPLLYLNDLASISPAYRAMESSRNVQGTQSGSSSTPSRTPPRTPNSRQASPFRPNRPPFQSPGPYGGNH